MMYIPVQFRLKNPYQNSHKVRVQILDRFGNLLQDSRVPQPEQTFPVVPGLNKLGFAVNDGPYQLMDVRFKVISGDGYSPCLSVSSPQVITVPEPTDNKPFLRIISSECSSEPFLQIIEFDCL